MLKKNGSRYLTWVLSRYQRLTILSSVVCVSLIVFDEHQCIERVVHVLFHQLLLDHRAALEQVVE